MKNSRLIAALLAATFMVSVVPVYAQKEGRVSRAKKQFNESIDRFNRCIQGKCTKREALKVARDIGATAIAVAVVVGTAYGVRTRFKKQEQALKEQEGREEQKERGREQELADARTKFLNKKVTLQNEEGTCTAKVLKVDRRIAVLEAEVAIDQKTCPISLPPGYTSHWMYLYDLTVKEE